LNSFLSKFAPLTNYTTDSDTKLNNETESVIKFVRGASFDKKESKEIRREVVLPVYGIVNSIVIYNIEYNNTYRQQKSKHQ
jgi:hypothetical protein